MTWSEALKIIFFTFIVFLFPLSLTHAFWGDDGKKLHVKIFTNENLNRDIFDQASPLKITFLQLSSKEDFEMVENLDLNSVGYKDILGESVVSEYTLMIQPDEIKEFTLDQDENSEYLGVVFSLRREDANWKYIFEKQENGRFSGKKNYFNLEVGDDLLRQLDLKESAQLTLDKHLKKFEKEGLDISGLSEKKLKKIVSNIEKNSYPKEKVNLDKGIYKNY